MEGASKQGTKKTSEELDEQQAFAESFHAEKLDKINMGTVKKIVTVFALTIPLSFSATAFVSWLVVLKEKKLEVGDLCGRSYQC